MKLETDTKSLSTDPYDFVIEVKYSYFIGCKTVGHIPREISRYVYFFKINQKQSVTNSFSRIGIFLSLTFSCKEKWGIDTKGEFAENVYSFEYSSNLHSTNSTFQPSDDEEDNDYQTITLETEVVEEEIDERLQTGLEIGKNLDMPIVTDDE